MDEPLSRFLQNYGKETWSVFRINIRMSEMRKKLFLVFVAITEFTAIIEDLNLQIVL